MSSERNQDGNEREPDQPRQPDSMKGLLKYAIEASKSGDTGTDQEPQGAATQALDSDRAEFLQAALQSLVADPAKELAAALQLLSSAREADCDPSHILQALDVLADLCDRIDLSNDLAKTGGLVLLEAWLGARDPEARWRAAHVLAVCSQNNPFVQEQCLKTGLLTPLLLMVRQDPSSLARLKALHALSCMVRNHGSCLLQFSTSGGFPILLELLQSSEPRLRLKATFLLSDLLAKNPSIREKLCELGAVTALESCLQADDVREQALRGLLHILEDSPSRVDRYVKDKSALCNTLISIHQRSTSDPAYQEEGEYSKQILQSAFSYTKI